MSHLSDVALFIITAALGSWILVRLFDVLLGLA